MCVCVCAMCVCGSVCWVYEHVMLMYMCVCACHHREVCFYTGTALPLCSKYTSVKLSGITILGITICTRLLGIVQCIQLV